MSDSDLRESLRSDLAEVERAIREDEWKSATVVAGSVVEALLLWALDQRRSEAEATGKKLSNPTKGPLEKWNLSQYLDVALALSIIRDETAAQLRIAKDFRNLSILDVRYVFH